MNFRNADKSERNMLYPLENRDRLRQFIQAYRQLPVLWDASLRDYTNREKRGEAYDHLLSFYKRIKLDANMVDLKKKINALRTNYRKELRHIEYTRRLDPNNVRQTRNWLFSELDFLRTSENFNFPTPSSASNEIIPKGKFSSPASPLHSNSLPNVKHEDELTAFETSDPLNYRSSYSNFQNTQSHRSPTNEQTQDSFFCKHDEDESVARNWTLKIRRMRRDQRLLAEKFINEIIFEGEWGTLHRGSVQINQFEPFPQYNNAEVMPKQQPPSDDIPDEMNYESQLPN